MIAINIIRWLVRSRGLTLITERKGVAARSVVVIVVFVGLDFYTCIPMYCPMH